MTRQQPRILERDIERTCTEFLALDGWRALKTDPVSDRARGKGFGEPGMADCLYIRYLYGAKFRILRSEAQALWIEWKRLNGKRATKAKLHQVHWHKTERWRGALTLIAGEDFPATIEGFMDWYFASGLARSVRPSVRPAPASAHVDMESTRGAAGSFQGVR